MLKISFFGGAQEVTGSCFLFENESQDGKTKILVDCGLFQTPKFSDPRSKDPFPFNPAEINALFVTHAHIDHTGRIPKLVKDGFRGKIYSTAPTRELSELMLIDSLGVLEKETGQAFYGEEDIADAFGLWDPLEYHKEKKVGNFAVSLFNSGHVLGSSMVQISTEGKKIVVTGDLGNPPTPLLSDPESIKGVTHLLIESTYGGRTHENRAERKTKLERVIEDTIKAGGVLMIPAFSLERTQELLFEINDLVESGRIPEVPIFLDSPLAIKATAIYKKYEKYFNKDANDRIKSGDDLFRFPGLKFTLTTEESKTINEVPAPKIVIAGSGMSNGGRIIHHERRYLQDPKSTLLLIGYQAAGSLGRIIQDGATEVTILGEPVRVRAKVAVLTGYSAHPDMEGLFNFVKKVSDGLEKVFVLQGEPEGELFFVQRLRDYLGLEAIAPHYGESYEL
ncbi:MBL fold metallo-hydrolase [Candidatus Giovannonibacteria bacterium]|nr:MBL fold metallo-hydrolase [Candidatus Giovannonibacteria bacterium]